jgi:hypothetical protein
MSFHAATIHKFRGSDSDSNSGARRSFPDYGRAPLSPNVHPGEIIDVEIRLQAPLRELTGEV